MNFKTELIPLNDGTKIAAPSKKTLMTNFVLKEQGDWFEHEIHFVREFIQADMCALDIGANYGLYSTAIANKLGESGHLWCFEPTKNTASALRETIDVNALNERVSVIEAGLSDHAGEATFYTAENAELNSLTAVGNLAVETLTIDLLTLDQCYEKYAWPKLDFIKLDAEGEELKILKAGEKTLTELSPLIMFELKHGDKVNVALISAFSDLGYSCYYLIPRLNILRPFDINEPLDGFLLNLFCCKSDTVERLEKSGLLLRDNAPHLSKGPVSFEQLFGSKQFFIDHDLKNKCCTDSKLENAIAAYIHYRDSKLDKGERYSNLQFAFSIVKNALAKGESNILALSTYARISFDIGQRSIGLKICEYIIKNYMQNGVAFSMDGLFVPVSETFEDVSLGQNTPSIWLCCSILDAVIRKSSFSLYFNGSNLLPMMEQLAKLNLLQDDLANRKKLFLDMKSK